MNKWIITAFAASLQIGLFTSKADANHRYGVMVSGYYQKYLGRPADPVGLQNWVCQMERGRCPIWVQAQFLGCHEYFQRCGCCHDAFITALFRDVLCDPDPCPRQVSYWCGRLRRCGYNRCALATEFLRYPHGRPAPAVSVRFSIGAPPPPILAGPFAPPPSPRPVIVEPGFYGAPGCPSGFGFGRHFPHH